MPARAHGAPPPRTRERRGRGALRFPHPRRGTLPGMVRVHTCALDRECRADAAPGFPLPLRLEVATRRHRLGIALRRRDRFERVDPVALRERREVVRLPPRWVEWRAVGGDPRPTEHDDRRGHWDDGA